MSKIKLKMRVIGDFSDGALAFQERPLAMVHAAVIVFETKEDAQAFAKIATFNYSELEIAAAPAPAARREE